VLKDLDKIRESAHAGGSSSQAHQRPRAPPRRPSGTESPVLDEILAQIEGTPLPESQAFLPSYLREEKGFSPSPTSHYSESESLLELLRFDTTEVPIRPGSRIHGEPEIQPRRRASRDSSPRGSEKRFRAWIRSHEKGDMPHTALEDTLADQATHAIGSQAHFPSTPTGLGTRTNPWAQLRAGRMAHGEVEEYTHVGTAYIPEVIPEVGESVEEGEGFDPVVLEHIQGRLDRESRFGRMLRRRWSCPGLLAGRTQERFKGKGKAVESEEEGGGWEDEPGGAE